MFNVDNFDTLITKAALHGAKLLKKSHQATAVGLASHLWWQVSQLPPSVTKEDEAELGGADDEQEKPSVVDKQGQLLKDGEDVSEKAVSSNVLFSKQQLTVRFLASASR